MDQSESHELISTILALQGALLALCRDLEQDYPAFLAERPDLLRWWEQNNPNNN